MSLFRKYNSDFLKRAQVALWSGCCLILFILSGAKTEAQSKADSLGIALKTENNPQKKATLLNSLAVELKNRKLNQAIEYATQSFILAESYGFNMEKGQAGSTLGMLYSYTSLLDSAIYWNKKSITPLLATGDSFEISRNYNRLGVDYLLKGVYTEAARYLLMAVKWGNVSKTKANAYNNLGMISKKSGDYAQAITYYFRALKEYETADMPANQALTLGNLGSLYVQRKDYTHARTMYEKAYQISLQVNDSESLGQALNGLGITSNRLGRPQEAMQYFEQSAVVNNNIGLLSEYAQQLINIADLLGEQKKYIQAEAKYLEGEKIFLALKDSTHLSAVYNNLGDLYFKQNKLKKAVRSFELSYAISRNFRDLNYNRLVVKNLSSIYESLGETKKALEYRKLYEELNEKMVNVAENVKIVQLNETFETVKKEKQLVQQNREIAQLQGSRRSIYIISLALALVGAVVLLLYLSRLRKQRLLEENIQSVANQISSLKDENSMLKTRLVETEAELRMLENKYKSSKEKLPESLSLLSKREYEVLLFIAEGLSDKEIAEKIFVSVTTVRTHIRRIYDKLLVKNRTEAILMLNRYELLGNVA